jgi:hypothetical protein
MTDTVESLIVLMADDLSIDRRTLLSSRLVWMRSSSTRRQMRRLVLAGPTRIQAQTLQYERRSRKVGGVVGESRVRCLRMVVLVRCAIARVSAGGSPVRMLEVVSQVSAARSCEAVAGALFNLWLGHESDSAFLKKPNRP